MLNKLRPMPVLAFALLSLLLAAPPAAAARKDDRGEKIRALLDTLKRGDANAPEPDLSLPGDGTNAPAKGARTGKTGQTGTVGTPAPSGMSRPAPAELPPFPPPAAAGGNVTISRERMREALFSPVFRYRLGPGDVIDVNVFDAEEINSKSYRVAPDGSIMLPLCGRVDVAGLTADEASLAVRARLSALFKEPQAVVMIKEAVNNFVLVLGRVNTPGRYEFKGRPTLLELFSLAKGVLPVGASPTQTDERVTRNRYGRALVFRGSGQVIEVDIDRLLNDGMLDLNLPLRSGDVVNIPYFGQRVFVLGQVVSPGLYAYDEKMTVLEALSLAGNSREQADLKRVRVVRREGDRSRVITFNVTDILRGKRAGGDTLRPDDVVYVPKVGVEKFLYSIGWINAALSTLVLGDQVSQMLEHWD